MRIDSVQFRILIELAKKSTEHLSKSSVSIRCLFERSFRRNNVWTNDKHIPPTINATSWNLVVAFYFEIGLKFKRYGMTFLCAMSCKHIRFELNNLFKVRVEPQLQVY